MTKRFLTLGLVAALAAVLSACSIQPSGFAARVNGAVINKATLFDAMAAINQSSGFRCLLSVSPTSAKPVQGTGSDTYDAALAAGVLTTMIEQRVLDQAVRNAHLHVSMLGSQLAYREVADQLNPPSGTSCAGSGLETIATIGANYRNVLVGVQQDDDLLAAHALNFTLDPAGVMSFGAQHPNLTEQACVSTLETSTQTDGQVVAAKIASGMPFAQAARTYSINAAAKTNSGVLGCYPVYELSAPFNQIVRSLAIGGTSQLVSFQGEFVLIHVDSRKPASTIQTAFAEVAPMSSFVGVQSARIEGKANVEVESDLGTWSASNGSWRVASPSGPSDSILPNAPALTPHVGI